MKTIEEQRMEERWKRAQADATELKRKRPDLNVMLPMVLLGPEARHFVEGLAGRAQMGEVTGETIYVTLFGRLHRVTIEDVEIDRRPRAERKPPSAPPVLVRLDLGGDDSWGGGGAE